MSGNSGSAALSDRAVLIAGPTASGKSALALEKAEDTGGIIINTDAMQVYDVLNVLTARPAAGDLRRAPHYLYGFVPPSTRFSTGAWLDAVLALVESGEANDRPLIFVGGTGLYFEALTKGFTRAPEVPGDVVARWNDEVHGLDRKARRALLERHDPSISARIREPDPQRVVRALSVLEATGRSLADWQDQPARIVVDATRAERLVLNPEREVLRQRIADRFAGMFSNGAVEEVEALLEFHLPADLPAMKAIGVPQIAAWLTGRLDRQEAIDLAVTATRQYAKRQRTWFRRHMADWQWV